MRTVAVEPMQTTDRARSGFRVVLLATVIAGIAGYAIQLIAPTALGSDDYVAFTVFWSTMYLGGAAISGVQQEISRAVRPAEGSPGGGRVLVRFGLAAAVIAAAAAVIASSVLGDAVLAGPRGPVALALVIGFVGYLATSILTGVSYGLHLWRAVATGVIVDALVRVALLLVGFAFGWGPDVLALLIAVPFGLAAVLVWVVFRRRFRSSVALDIGPQRLAVHVVSAVVAAAASGVMISGLPMLIGVTSWAAPATETGAILLALTVTRAPIVVPVIAFQSFLIATVFRAGGASAARLLRVVAVIIAGGVLLAVVGWFAGPWVVGLLSSGRYALSPAGAAVIVFSAALVAAMCVTGPALIALRRHTVNAIGWSVASVLTVLALWLADGEYRIPLALLGAPAVGLVVHLIAVLRTRVPAAPDSTSSV